MIIFIILNLLIFFVLDKHWLLEIFYIILLYVSIFTDILFFLNLSLWILSIELSFL